MRRRLAIVVLLSFIVVMAEAALTFFPAPGGWPTGLAYDGNVLYFFNAAGFRPIFRLDPSDGTVLVTFPPGA